MREAQDAGHTDLRWTGQPAQFDWNEPIFSQEDFVLRDAPDPTEADRPAAEVMTDLSGEHPMLQIPGELEKGNQDRLLPMAPEFAEFLLATPEAERTGPVFDPRPKWVKGQRLTAHRVGELLGQIGKAAGIKVDTDPKTGKVKYASAHDLRRSFGERWAARIMPPDLTVLMRHESIETTLRYYVGRDAQNTAKTLWQAMGKATSSNRLGNRAAESSSADEEAMPQSVDTTGFTK